jgi:large subunit ribosomal protein L21
MYAVIETGGKQYRVEVGTELEIELLEAAPGESVAFDRVLLIADGESASIGRPVVENATVSAEVLRRDRGEKLISFKYRPKARSRVKKGHRQELLVVRISDIVLDGKSAAEEVAKAEERRLTERQRLEEAAKRQAAQDAALAAKLAADKPAKAKSTDDDADTKSTSAASKSTGKTAATDAKKSVAKKASTTSGKSDTTESKAKGGTASTKAKADDSSKTSTTRSSKD